jgi:hypothetical protein
VTSIDESVPHNARVWDYWLGGKDNFDVDRRMGDTIREMFPVISDVAGHSRRFLRRAVTYLAGDAGIRQFLDIGTGLPTASNTHEVAQRIEPTSRVVYVDNDPLVLAQARALLDGPGVTDYVDADVHDPASILVAAAGTLDFTRPVAVMMLGILGNVADTDVPGPGEIVAQFLAAVPSGSYLTVNDSVVTAETAEAVRTARSGGADYHLRTVEQMNAFFAGLELVPPGVVPTPLWRPAPDTTPEALNVYCGVGRKQ